MCQYVPVAQLDRALVSGTRCRGFESSRARFIEGVRQGEHVN